MKEEYEEIESRKNTTLKSLTKQVATIDTDCEGCTDIIRCGDEYWSNDTGDVILCCECYNFEITDGKNWEN